MIIYYTHEYNKKHKGESHRLLEQAVGIYLASMQQDFTAGRDTHEEAARLVSSLRTTGEYGKPYMPGFAPFSISHSGNTWAVLIADNAEGYGQGLNCSSGSCGLDVQYPRKAEEVSISSRFFTPEDAALISDLQETARNEAFFRLWVRREAIVKAAGRSVAESDVPSVRGDTVEYRGTVYKLEDICIPDCMAYAAICFPADAVSDGELTFQKLL